MAKSLFNVGDYITDDTGIYRVLTISQPDQHNTSLFYDTYPFNQETIYKLLKVSIPQKYWIGPFSFTTEQITNFSLLPNQEYYKSLYDSQIEETDSDPALVP